jgi:hypothetical protein
LRLSCRRRERMGIRDRLRRLERGAEDEITTLVCQECGQEFRVQAGIEFELVAYAWAEGMKERGHEGHYQQPPEDVLRINRHPHSELSLVDKRTGRGLFEWGVVHEK